MSLTKNIEQAVDTYLNRLVSKYGLNKVELKNLWEGKDLDVKSKGKEGKEEKKVFEKISPERLLTSTNAELKAMCKARGLKRGGKKVELISRLLGTSVSEVEKMDIKPVKKSKSKSKNSPPPVIQKLAVKQALVVRTNEFGNYAHPETGLIFDPSTQKIIGKQSDCGKVLTLTPEDIELCKSKKFSYVTPSNLDENSDQIEVDINELEDEDEVELDEDEGNEEEELEEEELLEEEEEFLDEDEDMED